MLDPLLQRLKASGTRSALRARSRELIARSGWLMLGSGKSSMRATYGADSALALERLAIRPRACFTGSNPREEIMTKMVRAGLLAFAVFYLLAPIVRLRA
jgi:hypothetical protein